MKIPQNNKIITSLEQLKTLYPDLIDESTVGTFPGEKYHINVDPTFQPKWTAPRPVPVHQQSHSKKNSTNVKARSHQTSDSCHIMDIMFCDH